MKECDFYGANQTDDIRRELWSSGQLSGCGFKPLRHILDGVHKASLLHWKNLVKVPKCGTPPKKYTGGPA